MRIRPAVEHDAPEIARVHIASWLVTYRGLVPDAFLEKLPSTFDERAERWRQTITRNRPGERVLVAEIADTLVGFCIVNPCRDEDMPVGTGEVGAIYIHPAHTRKGIGSALMDAGLSFLREYGFIRATLWVLTTNATARAWYERKGWRVEGSTKIDDRGDVQMHETRYMRDL